jgi:hypothetical protein
MIREIRIIITHSQYQTSLLDFFLAFFVVVLLVLGGGLDLVTLSLLASDAVRFLFCGGGGCGSGCPGGVRNGGKREDRDRQEERVHVKLTDGAGAADGVVVVVVVAVAGGGGMVTAGASNTGPTSSWLP